MKNCRGFEGMKSYLCVVIRLRQCQMSQLRVYIPVRNCSDNAYGERCGTWHQGMAPYQPTVFTKTKVVSVRS